MLRELRRKYGKTVFGCVQAKVHVWNLCSKDQPVVSIVVSITDL